MLVAVLSSALPYTLEMEAMLRLSTQTFGLLLSAAPAVSALVSFLMLGEELTIMQWGAIICISLASAVGATKQKNGIALE
ncbi:MAG: EamA family transporter [Undibacterium umbellatum]|uniref:EamA family transporter n=1 Tax=Undibacterium umbellatum TaxID=2762300 RepID=UPI003BB76D38